MATAIELCRRADALSDEARAHLQPTLTPAEYVRQLATAGLYSDAMQYLAQAIPPREAIWWGCLCVEHAGAGQLPEAEEQALGAAVRWVLDPNDDTVEIARAAGDKAGGKTAAGCIAKAAGQAGAPQEPGGPVIPHRPEAVSRMIAAAVATAARLAKQQKLDALPQYVELGLQAASGQLRWIAETKSRKQEVRS